MGKQAIETTRTNVRTVNAHGQEERTILTVDDNFLPTPYDLEQYKIIDPKIVDFFIEASRKEQNHRHSTDRLKLRALNRGGNSILLVNFLGMFFAFLIMFGGLAFSFYLIYANKQMTGTVFAGATIISAAALFLRKVKKK